MSPPASCRRPARRRGAQLVVLPLAMAFVLLSAACSASGHGTAAPGDSAAPSSASDAAERDGIDEPVSPPSRTPTPRPETDDAAPEYPGPVEAARERHAVSLGVSVTDVAVVAYEEINWNDSSLGCGRPGEMYLQVITPGFRVVVSHDGETAVYHTDLRETPSVVRCNRPAVKNLGDSPAPGAPTE